MTVVSARIIKGQALPRFGPGAGSGGSGVGGGVRSNYSGAGSPEGVVIANVGAVYTNITTGGFWNKVLNDGSANGWNQLVA